MSRIGQLRYYGINVDVAREVNQVFFFVYQDGMKSSLK